MDDAVSSMVSAVLVLTMFTAAFGVWTVETVPDWIASNEHAHAGQVAGSFARMRADLDTAPTDGTGGTFAVDLAPDPIPLLQRAPALGTVEMATGPSFDLDFGNAHYLVASGGIMTAPATTHTTLSDVASLRALSLSIKGGQTFSIAATETATTSPRSASITFSSDGSTPATCTVETRAPSTATSPIASQEFQCAANPTINGLSDAYGFMGLLAQLDPEFKVEFTDSVPSLPASEVGIVYTDTNGLTQSLSGTGSIAGQNQDLTTDSVVFTPDYLEIEDRTVRFDAGAIVNVQGDVSTFTINPSFSIAFTGNTGVVRWTIIDVTGTGSLSGSESAVLEFRKIATKDLIVVDPAGPTGNPTGSTFKVTGSASAAWEDMWSDKLALAGITSQATSSHDSVAGTSELTLDSTNIDWTIHLTIHDVELSVT